MNRFETYLEPVLMYTLDRIPYFLIFLGFYIKIPIDRKCGQVTL